MSHERAERYSVGAPRKTSHDTRRSRREQCVGEPCSGLNAKRLLVATRDAIQAGNRHVSAARDQAMGGEHPAGALRSVPRRPRCGAEHLLSLTWEFIHDAQLAAIMVRGREIVVRVALPACPGFHFKNSLPETPGLNRVLAFICLIPLEAGRPRTLQAFHSVTHLKPGSGSNRDPVQRPSSALSRRSHITD